MTEKPPKTQRPQAQMDARSEAPGWFGVDPRVIAKRKAEKDAQNGEKPRD